MADLNPGSYSVNFIAAKTMTAPNKVNVTVVGGQNTDIGIALSKSSISGTISPANAVTNITATNSLTKVSNTIAPDMVSGIFKIVDLKPGTYTLSYAFKGFISPNNDTVTILSGQNFDMGIVTIDNYISYKMNGTDFLRAYTVTSNYSVPIFKISSTSTKLQSDVRGNILSFVTEGFYITLDNINGIGTYTCKGTAASNIKYLSQDSYSSASQKSWSTTNTGGSGTVTITSVDPVARTVAGTFTALLVPDNNTTTGTKTITSGTFLKINY